MCLIKDSLIISFENSCTLRDLKRLSKSISSCHRLSLRDAEQLTNLPQVIVLVLYKVGNKFPSIQLSFYYAIVLLVYLVFCFNSALTFILKFDICFIKMLLLIIITSFTLLITHVFSKFAYFMSVFKLSTRNAQGNETQPLLTECSHYFFSEVKNNKCPVSWLNK